MKKYIATFLVLAVMVGISGGPKAQTPTPGLVAAYSFDEGNGLNANDGSGNSFTGIISGATWTSAGKFGNALSFDGTSNWVTVADANALDLTAGMTLEAWVFPTAAATAAMWRNVIIKERVGGEVYNLYADTDTHVPGIYIVKGANLSTVSASGTSQIPINTWTHLAATYNNSTLSLYVNGNLVRSVSTSGNLTTSTGALRIGGNSVWGEFFQGIIDEVRVYNRALSQAEIQSDMVRPLGLAPPPPPPPGADQLGQWSGVADWPLVPIHMSLLPTGEVLSWDGFGFAPGSATLWNPTTSEFTSVPNGPNLFCAGHILMPDGRVLVLGGHVDVFVGINDTNIYNSTTRTWSSAAPMNFPRWYPTVTSLPDGRALVMSGNINCETCIADIPEIYDPTTDSWSELSSARLKIPAYPYNFLLPNGKILVAGGYHDSMPTRILDLTTQRWQVLDKARIDAGSAVMYAPGKIMKSGSSWESEPNITLSAATTYVLDTNQSSPQWRSTAPMALARIWHNLTVLPDGNVLVTGGSQTTDLFNLDAASLAAEMWSPVTETWTTMASGQSPRFYHSGALLLPDGRVLVAGGGRSGVDQLSAEIYSPPYLFKGSRPVISAAPPAVQYGANFVVQTPDAARIAKVSLIPLGSVTHTFNMTQRFVPLNFQSLSGSLDVQAPANGNLAPPGYYMLFIVDDGGVPSVAAFVRLPTPAEDIEPPTVSITNPTSGQNVSGTITVSANASDNVGVVGVQFKVDGNNLGVEDTTSPYSVSWNTTTVANGNRTLTAVARDAAGNTRVSSPVTVNVANSADTTPPSTPTGVTATAVSATQINLTWSASTDNVGVTGYRVFRDGVSVTTVTTTTYSDTGRQPSTTYSYTIAALDGAGNSSPQSSPPATATTPATTGLIAAYGFNEGTGTSTVDATGRGHTGTVSNATWTPAGKYGGAVLFNGTNSLVTVADANDLDLTTGMTLEAWVFPTTNNGVRDILIKEGSNVDIYNLYARNGGGRPESNVFVSGSNRAAEGTALSANVWTHVAGTFDGSMVRLYINGVQAASTAISGSIATSTGPLRIGGNSLWGEFFQGIIDDVRVYNRALTQAEIQADMNTPVGGGVTNTPPTITVIAPQAANEDTATGAIGFTVGDAQTAAGSLTVSGSSSNTTLVPNGNIVFGGSGANRTVTVTPAANQNGTATITVTVSDGQLSTPTSFQLTVNVVNDAPTIASIAAQTTTAGVAVGPLNFTVGDVETAAGSLTVSGVSNNTTLVPNGNIVFGGSGANRTVTVTPVAGQTGTATITVTVSDGQLSTPTSFLLTVNAGNTAPTITAIGSQITTEDTATGAIAFTVGDAQTAAGSLTVSGVSNNTTLVPNGNIVFGGSGASRTVTITPAANQNGTVNITVTVSDGQLSTPTSFQLTVNAVNDAPTITSIAAQTTTAGVAVGPLNFTVGDVETAAGSLTVSGVSNNTTLVPNGNIVFGGSGANRTVTVTPVAGQTGTATITVTVSDGQLSTPTSFQLTVNATLAGLVAAYSFNEGSGTSVTDASGNGHSGAISGATWSTQGKFGNALSFNGTSSWVTVADANDLDLTTGMTLEAWVFPTAAATATTWRNVIIKERTGGEIYNLYADTDTHVPAAYVVKSASPNAPVGASGTAQVPLSAWTHLAVTYNNSSLNLYVNGSLVRSVATSGALLTSTGVLRIGGNGIWDEFFQGLIDNVRIHNRALTQAEIQTDMNTPINP